jgi:cell division protein FtsL
MKMLVAAFAVAAFAVSLAACDRAQKALDTVGKAKSLKEDVEKKAKEVTDKARELIPGYNRGESGSQKEGDGEKDD